MSISHVNSSFATKLYVYLETKGRDELISRFKRLLRESGDRERSAVNIVRKELIDGGLTKMQARQLILEINNIYMTYRRRQNFLDKNYPKRLVAGMKPVRGGLPSLGNGR